MRVRCGFMIKLNSKLRKTIAMTVNITMNVTCLGVLETPALIKKFQT